MYLSFFGRVPNALQGRVLGYGWLLACLLLAAPNASAYHIAGADLTYKCLGNNQYEIRLRLLRDCSADNSGLPVAGFDNPIYLYIFRTQPLPGESKLFTWRSVNVPSGTPAVNPPDISNCGALPPSVCLQEGVYVTTITLPAHPGGYDIAWQRCCRNLGITNLLNPSTLGITFLTHVSGTDETGGGCNTQATFNSYPPLFLCEDKVLTMSHAATDADADSLAYAITNPFNGLNTFNLGVNNVTPAITPPTGGVPIGAPPYQNVPFAPGYTFLSPFGALSACNINPTTGELTIFPQVPGLFVFAISVFEYRNGVLIAENKRDVQVRVLPCPNIEDLPQIVPNLSAIGPNPAADTSANGDTIYVLASKPFCYSVKVTDPDLPTALLTTESNLSGASVTKTVAPNGEVAYSVCWTPSCANAGGLFRLAIQAEDPLDCQYYNRVFDTIWFKVVPPPSFSASIVANTAGNQMLGDTILITLDEDTACWAFVLSAPNADDSATFLLVPPPGLSTAAIIGNLAETPTSITGTICWPGGCEGVNAALPFRLVARRWNACGADSVHADTVWVRVVQPPNPPPTLSFTFEPGLTVIGDTLFVYPQSQPCITYTITDSLPGTRLTQRPSVVVEALQTGGTIGPAWQASNIQPLITTLWTFGYQGQLCWNTPCGYFGETLRVRLSAADSTRCGADNAVSDTFFIRILPPPNPRPSLSTDLSGVVGVSQDTVRVLADSLMCYAFTLADSSPASMLSASPSIQFANGSPYGGPLPTLQVQQPNDTTLAGTVCFRPSCEGFNDTLWLILTARDSLQCVESHRLADTLWIVVTQPANQPPTLTLDYNGAPITDTLTVIAEDSLCVNFVLDDVAADALFGQHLSAEAEVLLQSGNPAATPAAISLTAQSDTLLAGRVCWESACDLLGQTVLLRITGVDSSTCTRTHALTQTVLVRVLPKPSAPISLSLQAGEGIILRADTLVFQPKRAACATLTLTDTANGGALSLEALGDVFGQNAYTGPLATISDTAGMGTVLARFCWQPNCANLGPGLWPVRFVGTNRPECAQTVSVELRVWIKVEEPVNRPPTVDILDLPEGLFPGAATCFRVLVADPDAFALLAVEGISEAFLPGYEEGGNISVIRVDTFGAPTPRLEAALCLTPNCYAKLETYTIRMRAVDSTSCSVTLLTEAEQTLPVADCGIHMPNVFTPNADGVNDGFGPAVLEGVQRFRMHIFDRWGGLVYATEDNGRWAGQAMQGGPAAEGLYYYRIEYVFYSGTGRPLVDNRTGSVLLLR